MAATFVVELIDKVTGPAKRAEGSVRRLKGGVSSVKTGMLGTIAAGTGLGLMLGQVASQIGNLAVGAIKLGISLGTRLAGGFIKATFAAADFAQQQEFALGKLLKSSELGAKQFDRFADIAESLGLPLEETIDQGKSLIAAGFVPKDAEDLVKLSADLKAISGSAEKAKRVLFALGQVRTAGILRGGELLQLSEAGVNIQKLFTEIGKILGKTPADVKKLQQAGKVSADVAVQALKNVVKGTGELGDTAKEAGDKSGTALIDGLKTSVARQFTDFGRRVGPTLLEELKPAVTDVIALFKTPEARAVGDLLVDGLKLGIRGIGGVFRGLKEFFKGFGEFVKPITDQIREFGKALAIVIDPGGNPEDTASSIKTIGQATGQVILGLLRIGTVMLNLIRTFQEAQDGIGETVGGMVDFIKDRLGSAAAFVASIGPQMTAGLAGGITDGSPGVFGAIDQLVAGIKKRFASAPGSIEVGSPSRLFKEYGQDITAGLAVGIDSGANEAERAVGALVPGALPESTVAAAGGAARGGGGVNVEATITIEGGQDTAEEIAIQVRDAILGELTGPLEELAIESGAV